MSAPTILKLVQGSAAWHQHRSTALNASDAPAMMGASKYRSRADLIRQCATGIVPDVNEATQRLFDAGHAAEAATRPLIEAEIGDELYPVIVLREVDGLTLSASLDGQTMDGVIIWEHKLWSESLAAQVRAKTLEPHYYWQLEHQLMASNASRAIFTVSDGADKRESMEYDAFPGRSEQLIAGWKQFHLDLAAYVPEPEAAPIVAGRAPDQLPALRIEVTGMVTASNLAEFRTNALAVIHSINTELTTDEHFANAEETVKWCKGVEDRLEAAKAHALSQTASIDELFRTIDAIAGETRAKRLDLDKLVKHRKEAVKGDIVRDGRDAIAHHYSTINATLGDCGTPIPLFVGVDIANAIKGKRTLSSMRDAVATAVASAKIDASAKADKIRACMAVMDASKDHAGLFPDRSGLCMSKEPDDLRNLIAARIAEHEAREAKRIEAERERIRQEEVAKLERQRAADELAAAKQSTGVELSPAAQALNEAEGTQRFAQHHPAVSNTPPAADSRATPTPAQGVPAPVAHEQSSDPLGSLIALRGWAKKHRIGAAAYDDLMAILAIGNIAIVEAAA